MKLPLKCQKCEQANTILLSKTNARVLSVLKLFKNDKMERLWKGFDLKTKLVKMVAII